MDHAAVRMSRDNVSAEFLQNYLDGNETQNILVRSAKNI